MAAEAIAALTQAEEAARAALLSPRSGGTNPTEGDGAATPTEGNKGAMNTLNYTGDDEGGDGAKKKRSSSRKASAGTKSGQSESRESSPKSKGKSRSRTKEQKAHGKKDKKKRRSKSRRRSQTRSSRGGRSSRRGRSRRHKSRHSSEDSSPERRRGKDKKRDARERPSPVRASSRSPTREREAVAGSQGHLAPSLITTAIDRSKTGGGEEPGELDEPHKGRERPRAFFKARPLVIPPPLTKSRGWASGTTHMEAAAQQLPPGMLLLAWIESQPC